VFIYPACCWDIRAFRTNEINERFFLENETDPALLEWYLQNQRSDINRALSGETVIRNAVPSLGASLLAMFFPRFNGSALVLFTSYQLLQKTWETARKELEPLNIRCFKQGDDDRTRLLQSFLADESSCLFATDSFWEGVDAPGDTLRLVIICRLPFRTPDDPIFEARSEAIQKQGKSPFMELSLPMAVMRFKQGFGRLIRRSSDRGIVAVLDGRLLKKTYGQLFLASLPKTKASFGNLSAILRDIEYFLY